MYKMSQDPLELFFGSIRSGLGHNNNPTVVQFKSVYTKLCAGSLVKAGVGSNCLWDESTTILTVKQLTKASESEDTNSNFSTALEQYVESISNEQNELKRDILIHISGFIQNRVTKKLDCGDCDGYLAAMESERSCGLIEVKDRGGLVRPHSEVVTVVTSIDSLVEFENKCGGLSSNFFQKNILISKCLSYINDNKPHVFHEVCDDPTHRLKLLKSIILLYLNVKLGHLCKLQNQEHKKNIRHMSKKMPIFNHE